MKLEWKQIAKVFALKRYRLRVKGGGGEGGEINHKQATAIKCLQSSESMKMR